MMFLHRARILATHLLIFLSTLVAGLTQQQTNGNSLLGTSLAPALPAFLTDNPLPNGFPWNTMNATNTNPYEQSPDTGVYRNYNLTIKRAVLAPDGVNKSMIVINGAFPGPTLEANWGDWFNITVNNEISDPEEGTTLHWLLQKETPYYDGVPSVGQCPITPGKSFTYTFKAGLYGTSWYHSHYSAQYAAGIAGPMIIYGPPNAHYDIDVGPVALSDWYHKEYFNIVQTEVMADGPPPPSDNNLINGKGDLNCIVPSSCTSVKNLATFNFTTGKTHRLRLINPSAEAIQRFTIDNHTMTIIANDFVPVKPYTTSVVTLGVGQRTDVLVEANLPTDSAVWMRSDISVNCSTPTQPHALAVIYYPEANRNAIPTSAATPVVDDYCGNDNLDLTTPFFPFPATVPPATTLNLDITFEKNESNINLWKMNGQTFRADYNNALLLLASQGNTSFPNDPEWNVYNFGSNTSIRIIVKNHYPRDHPMHMHGHNFQVLAEGFGDWNGSIAHPENTQRRDVQLMPGSQGTTVNPTDGAVEQPGTPSFMVVQIDTDNPGVWPFHCHIAWHVSAGLYINIFERPGDITEKELPSVVAQTCNDWAAWSSRDIVDQIDSGE